MTYLAHRKRSSVLSILAPGLILGALGLGATLMAQTRQIPPVQNEKKLPAPPAATKATEPGLDNLQFIGHWTYDGSTGITAGNDFVYTRGDSITKGDHGKFKQINKKTNEGILDAEGNLVFDDPQHHATCNKAHVDMTTKLAVFTESVVLVLKPDKAAGAPSLGDTTPADGAVTESADNGIGSQKKRGATVYCDRMEDQYRKKYIKLYGHVLFKQTYKDKDGKQMERVLTAEHAEYNGKTEILLLFGPVDGHDGNGQEVHSPNKVTVGTKEGQETMEGDKISLKFLPEEDTGDDDNADAKDAKGADAGKEKTGKEKTGSDTNGTDKSGTGKAGNTGKGPR